MNDDHRTPWTAGGEKETLVDFLDYLRAAIIRKAEGLPEDDARTGLVPSGTSLLGLVKHLVRVEVVWFQWAFAGLDVGVPRDALTSQDTRMSLIETYRAAFNTSNDIIATCNDLSTRCQRAAVAPEPMTLRWVLVHLVEESARHAGHADILREQLDGSMGR